MAASRDNIYKAALALDEKDRAELVARLLESLDTETETGVEAAWVAEIEKRIRDLDSGRVKTIPWSQARSQLRSS